MATLEERLADAREEGYQEGLEESWEKLVRDYPEVCAQRLAVARWLVAEDEWAIVRISHQLHIPVSVIEGEDTSNTQSPAS